jgi:FkbH-like protein
MINEYLSESFNGNASRALKVLEKGFEVADLEEFKTILRIAIFQPSHSLLNFQKIYNLWTRIGKVPLKPNPVKQKVFLLTDFTADNLVPLISTFCGAQGVETEILLSSFNSVEQTILDPSSTLYTSKPDIVVWVTSNHWFQQFTGKHTLVEIKNLEKAKETFFNLIDKLKSQSSAEVLVSNIPGQGYPLPSGSLSYHSMVGLDLAVSSFNVWLAKNNSDRIRVIDLSAAIFRGGGRNAMGTLNYLRARMAYEPPGTIAVSREIASAISHVSGKTHRALVVDWDNTIWGGEVAELGSFKVECGYDTPDALGYRLIQEYIKALKTQGTLLAGVSRNDPGVIKIFQENLELVLKEEDFASIQLSWEPKSSSISRVSEELGFGSEFMVFMDDNIFEIAQVLTIHPFIDVIFAGPTPDQTLDRLSTSSFFNSVSLSKEDLERSSRGTLLKEQREMKAQFDNIDDFLQEINIVLKVSPLNDDNRERVVQMFQKSNQFNLTTRRHREAEFIKIKSEGEGVFAFTYTDSFGSQGVISVVNLILQDDRLLIESWVMSCRVLNRTVEQAVFNYILKKANGKIIHGEYIPTEKNKLVKNLYDNLGFKRLSRNPENGVELWEYSNKNRDIAPPAHFTTIKEVD